MEEVHYDGNTFTAPQNFLVAPAGTEPFTKPIILLTSQLTLSAGETFAMGMKAVPDEVPP